MEFTGKDRRLIRESNSDKVFNKRFGKHKKTIARYATDDALKNLVNTYKTNPSLLDKASYEFVVDHLKYKRLNKLKKLYRINPSLLDEESYEFITEYYRIRNEIREIRKKERNQAKIIKKMMNDLFDNPNNYSHEETHTIYNLFRKYNKNNLNDKDFEFIINNFNFNDKDFEFISNNFN